MSARTFLEFRMMDKMGIREICKSDRRFDDLLRLFEDYRLTEINFFIRSSSQRVNIFTIPLLIAIIFVHKI